MRYNIKKDKPVFKGICTLAAILFFLLHLNNAYSLSKLTRWGISQDNAIEQYLSDDSNYISFNLSDRPQYNNKILNYIIAINSNLKSRIKIIKSSKMPIRDFLFIKNKLYSILENYGIISIKKQDSLIARLIQTYGTPSIQYDRQMTIYSFKNNKTKVILVSSHRSQQRLCKIYYYANRLFKMLIVE